MLAPAQKIRSFWLATTTTRVSGMLEADTLDGVGELDVDTEIVRIQLQPVSGR